jgi:hypothetical protein
MGLTTEGGKKEELIENAVGAFTRNGERTKNKSRLHQLWS